MPRPFFPDPVFGWVFLAVLATIASIAAWIDLRRVVVPKWVTFTCLGTGLFFSLVRGALLADSGEQVFLLEGGAIWNGILDGFLFALAGVGLGFAIFFVLWIFGACGGGDVKFFAALGAWLGPRLVMWVFAVSLVTVTLFIIIKLIRGGLAPSSITKTLKKKPKMVVDASGQKVATRMRLTFSLPLALATVLVLLWQCRFDLRLAVPPPDNQKEQAHAKR
jgi:prepilin peptidase CpaA